MWLHTTNIVHHRRSEGLTFGRCRLQKENVLRADDAYYYSIGMINHWNFFFLLLQSHDFVGSLASISSSGFHMLSADHLLLSFSQ